MSDFAAGYAGESAPFMGGVSGMFTPQGYGSAGAGDDPPRNPNDGNPNDASLSKGPSFIEYQKKERERSLGQKKLITSTFFCFIFMCAEIVGGYMANSLAIMTDAAHLMSDLSAFGISILAISLARRAKTDRMSFGSGRAEVIGAVTSIVIIWALTAWLILEAIDRTLIILAHKPLVVNGKLMTIVASLGILVNLIMFAILGHSHGPGGGDHSHADAEDGGHSHAGEKKEGGHSHSHGDKKEGGHSHSHGDKKEGGHSHSHGEKKEGGHSHSHGDKKEGGHSHSHGEKKEGGHSHSHGDKKKEGGHSHSHGDSGRDAPKKNWEDWFIDKLTGGHSHGGQELNVRAALVHVIGDFVQSLGVLIAAVVIWRWPEAKIADPLCTFLFSILVLFTTVPVMKDSLLILLETVPSNTTEQSIKSTIRSVQGVRDIVDLHCWSISQGVSMLVLHVKPNPSITTADQCFLLVDTLRKKLYEKHGLHHCTIEIDSQWLIEQQTCFFAFGDTK